MTTPVVQLSNVTKRFRTKSVKTVALNRISLTIDTGEFVAVMGPSGCGKSTLLSVIGLLSRHDSGDVCIFGRDVTDESERQRALIRREHIGVIFQSFNLLEELTVYENVELALSYRKEPTKGRAQLINNVLDKLSVLHRSDHYPSQMSGGQQQRAAIARAIVTNPDILLADEPTGNLDRKNGDSIMGELAALNKQGTTVVMVTHSLHDANHANRTINLSAGQLQ